MKNRTMSKQHTPTPKYKVHEFRNTLDIWTSNSTSFICSVPTNPFMEEDSKEKIEFVLNILNNHGRLVEVLEKLVETTFDSSCQHFNAYREAKQLLTELKSER